MKRNSSSVCLKSLAMSIKNSIKLDVDRTTKRQFIPLKTARSTVNLRKGYEQTMSQTRNSMMIIPKRIHIEEGDLQTAESDKLQKISTTEQQIAKLEASIVKLGKFNIRNYSTELKEYDRVAIQIQQTNHQYQQQVIVLNQYQQQQQMLQEDARSSEFRVQEQLAEKQYYEQLITTYSKQYPRESQLLIAYVQLQSKQKELNNRKNLLQSDILQKSRQFQQWREEEKYDLMQQKNSNLLKELRIALMQIQQQVDQKHDQEQKSRKLRQHMCLFLKHRPQVTYSYQDTQDGLEIHLCRQGLVADFIKYLKQKYQKGTVINNYCSHLKSIEQVVKNKGTDPQQVIHKMMRTSLQHQQTELVTLNRTINNNEQELTKVQTEIQLVCGNQCITFIQYMQNSQHYDIQLIRGKLKTLQKQQKLRISTITSAYQYIQTHHQVYSMATQDRVQHIKQQTLEIGVQRQQLSRQMQKKQRQIKKLIKLKQSVENIISDAISKWKQYDYKKQQLTKLYRNLNNKKHQQLQFIHNKYQHNKSIYPKLQQHHKLTITKQQPKYPESTHKPSKNKNISKIYPNTLQATQHKSSQQNLLQWSKSQQNRSSTGSNMIKKPLGQSNRQSSISKLLINRLGPI